MIGKDKDRYSFEGKLKGIKNTMEFSHIFILQLRRFSFDPGTPTLLMTRTS